MLGLLVLTLGACGPHTPLVNETHRTEVLAARAAARNDNKKDVALAVESPTPIPAVVESNTRTKKHVTPNLLSFTSSDAVTIPRYPFLTDGSRIPAVFSGHPSGQAYLSRDKDRFKISSGPNVEKPPHSGKVFDTGKRSEPTNANPYTILPGEDGTSSLSLGLGPVAGGEVQGSCTADGCVAETYYLLLYDDGMEERLKKADVFYWDDVSGKSWKAYILKPKFTEFAYSKPTSLKFSSTGNEFSMKLPDGTDWLNHVELTDDQPVNVRTDGQSIRIYRLLEGETPILIGMVKNDLNGNELWFFALPAPSSSATAGK